MRMLCARLACGVWLAVLAPVVGPPRAWADHVVQVFERAPIGRSADAPPMRLHDPYILRERGQIVERPISLPPEPANQRAARRIIARVTATPVQIDEGQQVRIADPWTRLGHVTVVHTGEDGEEGDADEEIELMRFITAYGGETTYEADLSCYAPVLSGDTVFRVHLSTWVDPAWEVSLTLHYLDEPPGYRRPTFAAPVMTREHFTSRARSRTFEVTIPAGVRLPRMRVLSTGHGGVQEFASATHVLKVGDHEVARWRPWREDGGTRHDVNLLSERWDIDGRELWSADLDRAGWMPGAMVEPEIIPLPELTPGKHRITLELHGIRPMPEDAAEPIQGAYWVVSAAVVADEPWPDVAPTEEDPEGDDEGDRP